MAVLRWLTYLGAGVSVVALLLACDESGEDGTGGQSASGGAGGGGENKLLTLRFLEPGPNGDTPIEGVIVAADANGRRVERITGPAGYAHVFVPYTPGGSFDWIGVKRGYPIAAGVELELDDPSLDDEQQILLPSLTAEAEPVVSLTVSAANVPVGGSYCVGFASWHVDCSIGIEILNLQAPEAFLQGQVMAMARNDLGEPVELAEVAIQGDGAIRTASIVFDGASEVAPVTSSYRIQLPADPDSPFRTADLDASWTGYLSGVQAGTFLVRSATHGLELGPGGQAYNLRYTEFAATSGAMSYAMAVYADFMQPIRTFRWFSGKPAAGTLEFIDAARLTTVGETVRDELEFTEVPGAERYTVVFSRSDGQPVVHLQAPPGVPVRLPDPPAAHTAGPDDPHPGDAGYAHVLASQGGVPVSLLTGYLRPNDTFDVDAQASWGPREPITF